MCIDDVPQPFNGKLDEQQQQLKQLMQNENDNILFILIEFSNGAYDLQ